MKASRLLSILMLLQARGRMTANALAQMIAFLVSPAGDFVTGTTLVIDGGVVNVDLPPGRRP